MKLGPSDRKNIRSRCNLPSKLPKNLQKKSYHTCAPCNKKNAAKSTSIIFNETYTKLSEITHTTKNLIVLDTIWGPEG